MSNMALPPAPPPATRPGIAAEVETELQGQIAPLEIEASGFARAETRAMEDLNALFAGIMPFVAGSAERVAEQYGATNRAQSQIFDQAWQRLNSLRGQRASEAQALAQQIGAPISLDNLFTEAIDVERGAFVPEAAGELLKASMIGQAGVQQVEAFAGRVMPLKQARMSREVKNYYRDQITDLRKQISALKAMKPGLVNERLRARQLEDYEMRLNRAEALFQREQTKRTLALEEARHKAQIAEWEREYELTRRGQDISVSESAKERAARIKLTKLQKQAGKNTYVTNTKQNILGIANALAAGSATTYEDFKIVERDPVTNELVLDAAGNPITYTESRPIPGAQPTRNPIDLLNKIIATTGISKGQKELYGFAVKQVRNQLIQYGMVGIPEDPSQWAKWWKQRQNRLRRQANPPRPTPGPPPR